MCQPEPCRRKAVWGTYAGSLDPSVPSSLQEFNRERMGDTDAEANFPSPARASVTPGTEGTCCGKGTVQLHHTRCGQDHRCPIRCSGSSPNVAFGPVQLAIPCPAVMTCAGFRVALPSRGSLESSKTWVVGEASFIGAGRIPSRQPCLALGQLGRRGSSAKKLISLVEALLAADCWGLDLHALHSFRCNSCSGSLV